MNVETEQGDSRARLVDDAMAKVRGRAQASRGLVVVETDAYGTITDLQISPSAMNVESSRLAAAITRCHSKARQEAETEAARLLGTLTQQSRPAGPVSSAANPAYDYGSSDVDDPDYHPNRAKSRIIAD